MPKTRKVMKIKRPQYLQKLIEAENNGAVKVVTGIRRCGKSYLVKTLFVDFLLKKGIPESDIIIIDLEDKQQSAFKNPDYLLSYVNSKVVDITHQYYVIIDEVQKVTDFVDVVSSIALKSNVDVYVTGSNSKCLSKDVATEFRGRGDEIHMFPLSFSEFMTAFDGTVEYGWYEYMLYGGLPHSLTFKGESGKVTYLKNLYQTVYLNDIYERHDIENKEEFEELVKILASCIGSPTNPTNLANTFKSVNKLQSITDKTVSTYIEYIEDAFLISKAERYDIKGKQYIGASNKYYFQDTGLRNAILDFRQNEWNHIMENVIYNELCIRGFNVDVGNVSVRRRDADGVMRRISLEVDFVANLGSRRYYIQSAWRMPDAGKIAQESQSLLGINDSFKKIIVVGENVPLTRDVNGIVTMGYKQFLLDTDSLDK